PICFLCYRNTPDLPSFPTRRSSDLGLYFHFTDSQAAATDEITMSSTAAGASVPSGGQFTIDFAVTTSTHNYNGIQWEIAYAANRSEEHTSELQSRGHLVCRLLLEKK